MGSSPLESVSETMRSLAVDAVAGVPAFVAGVSIIRGVLESAHILPSAVWAELEGAGKQG